MFSFWHKSQDQLYNNYVGYRASPNHSWPFVIIGNLIENFTGLSFHAKSSLALSVLIIRIRQFLMVIPCIWSFYENHVPYTIFRNDSCLNLVDRVNLSYVQKCCSCWYLGVQKGSTYGCALCFRTQHLSGFSRNCALAFSVNN